MILCEESTQYERKEEEKKVEKDRYPWLDDNNEKKYMTGREILEKTYKLG